VKQEPILAASQRESDRSRAGIERRNLPRYTVQVKATFEVGQATLQGELHNLNAEGAYLKSEVILPQFATLQRLIFQLPGCGDIEIAEALVVWNNDGTSNGIYPRGMGLFFASIQPDYTQRIKYYLNQQPAD
jgi:PilZ domain